MRLHRALAATAATAAAVTLLATVPAYAATPTGVTTAPVPAQPGRRPDGKAGARRTGRLVVAYHPGASPAARAAARNRVGAQVQGVVRGRNAELITVRGKAGDAALALRRDPAVRFVEPESTYRTLADAVGPERAEIGVDSLLAAHPTFVGTGVEVAVIDTAVNAANTDLAGRVVNGGDFSVENPFNNADVSCVTQPTKFDCAHGTAVAGVIAAAADGTGMVGVAPDATIVSYNVFRTGNFATSVAIANAIDAAVLRAQSNNLRVINMSLGGMFDSRLVREAVAGAHAAGVVVVVAAGNDGSELANYPAGDPFTVSVGASERGTDGLWRVAAFSNRGDVDLIAPGKDVKVWLPPSNDSSPPLVRTASGTSFAAPMVAGMAAMLAQQGFTGDVARAALVAGAKARHGNSPYPAASGAGRADAQAAYAVAAGSTPYTAVFIDRGGQVANVVGRRTVEALRVDPDEAEPNAHATITTNKGSIGAVANVPAAVGTDALMRTTATYATPGTNLGTVDGLLTANGGAGGEDSITVPLRFLDPADGPEGTNAYSGEGAWAALKYGTRSTFVRSVGLRPGGALEFDFEYADSSYYSTMFAWMPETEGGVADAAAEPWGFQQFTLAKGRDGFTLRPEDLGGRWKIGWYTFDPKDNGNYYFRPFFAQPVMKLSAPGLVSSSGTGLPFRVSWATNVSWPVVYDVRWTKRVKSGTRWVTEPWRTWYYHTGVKTAVFGGSNLPIPVVPGGNYLVQARVVDNYGNASPWAVKQVVEPLNDNTVGTNWYGGWAVGKSGLRWLGDVHFTNAAGRKLVVVTEGQQFQVVGDRCTSCGAFRVYLDGVLKATVDSRGGALAVRQVLWNSGVLSGGTRAHRLELVTLGTPGRPTVSIDAIGVTR